MEFFDLVQRDWSFWAFYVLDGFKGDFRAEQRLVFWQAQQVTVCHDEGKFNAWAAKQGVNSEKTRESCEPEPAPLPETTL